MLCGMETNSGLMVSIIGEVKANPSKAKDFLPSYKITARRQGQNPGTKSEKSIEDEKTSPLFGAVVFEQQKIPEKSIAHTLTHACVRV
jgi:hypothetical protein